MRKEAASNNGIGVLVLREDVKGTFMQRSLLLGALILAFLLIATLLEQCGNRRRYASQTRDRLDEPLLWWLKPSDPFTVRDLLNGGVAITGRAGSGKTSSSGAQIGRSVVQHRRSGGLILAAKPEDLGMWQRIFQQAGREDDLLVFAPDSELRFNFLDYEMRHGGHTRNITKVIMTIGETLKRGDSQPGGEEGQFWEQQNERMIYNAVEVVKLATDHVSAPDIQQFISTAAQNPAQINTPEWQALFHNQCLKAAFHKPKSSIEAHDYQLATDYWLSEFPTMADKTRSSIITGVMGILHVFNTGVVRELVSTTTNVSPDDTLAGKWVLVNMAPAEWGDLGTLVATGWKFLTQRRVLRRAATEDDCINVIWCDEAHQFVNSYDSHYLAQCRSHLGCMVFLTQSLHSYYAALKGQTGRHQADMLLTNFHTKIFHAVGDVKTAEWAAGLIGKSLQTFVGSSMAPPESLYDEFMGAAR